MGMCEIFTAEIDDSSVATNGRVIVLTTVLAQKPLHQPCLGELRRNIQNSIEKNLRNLPPFLGDCTGSMSPINADKGVLRPCAVDLMVIRFLRIE